jgi:LmbE family N-acetylglucosaminyl deacetylase
VDAAALGTVVAVSPHLDDAALSAGNFLSTCDQPVLLTVFAGMPERYGPLTAWDALCGFAEGDDVVALRRVEDRRAAAKLGATARWLEFVDSQYRSSPPSAADVAAAIASVVTESRAATIALPLGILHDDHRLTHDACELLLRNQWSLVANWVAWSDVPYRARSPQHVADRLESLRQQGFQLSPSDFSMTDAKRAALKAYASQVAGLGEVAMRDAAQPEQLFLVSRQ